MYKRTSALLVLLTFFFTGINAQNTLVKSSPDDLYRNGLELIDKQKFGAARESFTQFIKLQPNTIKAIDAEYYVAYCALSLFNSDGEGLVNSFIEKYPYHAKTAIAYFDLGGLYYNNKKYDKAIEYYEKVNDENLSETQKNERYFKLGYAYFTGKNFDKALPNFNFIKNKNNTYTYAACYYAGYIELKNNAFEDALSDLTKAEKNEEYQPLIPHMITKIYYRQSKFDDVISYGEKSIQNSTIQSKSEISLMVADAWFFKKDYKKALENFDNYIKEEKSVASKEVTYRIGYSQYKNDKFEDASTSFKKNASANDTIGQASAYYLGLSYLKLGTKEYALLAFEHAGKFNFNKKIREEALFLYSKLNVDLQRYKNAIPALKEFISTYDVNSERFDEANELLSESLLKTNNYSEAISYIESMKSRSIIINKTYQKVTYYKATEYFNAGKYKDAGDLFDKSLKNTYDLNIQIACLFWKAEIASINKEYDDAINLYAKVFEKSENNQDELFIKSRYGIGYAYYNTKQYDKALPHFKEYVKEMEKSSSKAYYTDALLRLADLYYVNRAYAEAANYYDLAIKNFTTDIDYAYFQKGIVLVFEEQLQEAKNSFEIVINKYPTSVYYEAAIYQKAQLDFRSGDLNAALTGFTKLIGSKLNSHPYEPNALLKRALIYSSLKKYDEAIADYNTILDKYYNLPIHEDALRGAQEAYSASDRSEDFNNKLEEFKLKNPQSIVLEGVGFESVKGLYFEGKFKKAITLLEDYLSKYPQSANAPDARFFLADSYYSLGNIESAMKNYELVVAERKSIYVTKSLQKLADINFKNKQFAISKNYYQLFFANAKSKKEKNSALIGLMESNYFLAQFDSSEHYAGEVLKGGNVNINAESKANMCLGKIAFAKEEYDKATDYFLNLVNYNNEITSAEAQYYIAEILYKQKKHKQSIESLYYLNNNFDSDDYWLGKSFLLISENLIALNELFQAKSTLKSIIQNSKNAEIVKTAQERLDLLESQGKEEEEKP